MSKVFVSYSRQDGHIVYPIVTRLKGQGVPIWIDQQDIDPGKRWDIAIEKALNEATHVLIVLSKSSVGSQNVRDEIDWALDEGKIIVPILINECNRPLRIRRMQYTDFTKNTEEAFNELLRILPHELNISNPNNSHTISNKHDKPTLPMDEVHLTLPATSKQFVVFPEDRKTIQEGGNYIYPTLIFMSMDKSNKRHWLMKINTIYIGREYDCDIVVPVQQVSRRHIQIQREAQKYKLIDLNSTNGTWINGDPLKNSAYTLQHGDMINLGNVLIIQFQFITPNINLNEDTSQMRPIDFDIE